MAEHQQSGSSSPQPSVDQASSSAGTGTLSNSCTSSPDTDKDFDPSADMMVHDFDDERTLEEEENMESDTSCGNELDDLQKEGDMPLEELLTMYGYQEGQETRSSSEEEILSNQDLTLDKDEVARDLLTDEDHDKETSVNELLNSVPVTNTSRLLRSTYGSNQTYQEAATSDSESDDEDYEPGEGDWKKTIQVGSAFQAIVPEGLCKYGDAPAYENEDKMLWDPYKLDDKQVEWYLQQSQDPEGTAQGVNAIPTGAHIKDDEQALYTLLSCGHNLEEALRRRRMQPAPATDTLSLWSEEETRNFENGLRIYGKDFHAIQQNKVRTRSVGELVQFYYLWKKTERHDMFANKVRMEKKKLTLHPGITDYMDRFLDEQDNPGMAQAQHDHSPSLVVYGPLDKDASERAAIAASRHLAPPSHRLLQDSAVDSSHMHDDHMVDSIRNISPQELTGIIHDIVKSHSSGNLSSLDTPEEVQTAMPTVHSVPVLNETSLGSNSHVISDSDTPAPKRMKLMPNPGPKVIEKVSVSMSTVSSHPQSAVSTSSAGILSSSVEGTLVQ